MPDFVTTLTAAAIAMCQGLCSPLEKMEVYKTGGSVGLIESYFLDPKSPVIILHPEARFDYARSCYTIRDPSYGEKGPLHYCESFWLDTGNQMVFSSWKKIADTGGECVLVANSRMDPDWMIEHYVCRDAGIS